MNDSLQRYPALAVQRGMVLQTLRQPGAGVDVQQVTIRWDGPPDRDALTAAWQAATDRHAVLRTAFEVDGDHGVVQVVPSTVAADLRWRDSPVDDFLPIDRYEPFDVGRAPLLRVTTLADHHVVVTFHHAILDGRSTRMLLDEVLADYAARRAGRLPDPPRRPPFADFVHWSGGTVAGAARTGGPEPSTDDAFWQEHLAGVPLPRALPGRLDPAPGARGVPATHEVVLTRQDSDRLRAAAATAGAGVSAVVHAAWALLRGGYGGVDDVTFAVTRSCRYDSVPDAEQILGLLINTVPLRIRCDPEWTVRKFLADVADRIRRIREHQLTPLHAILDRAGLAPDTPLLDTLLVFERQRLATALAEGGPEPARHTARVHRMPGYPLTVHAFDEPELRLGVTWDATGLLTASARRILAQLHHTVLEVAGRPDTRLAELDLGAAREAPLRATWNATRRPYPRDRSVPEVFAARVADDPAATALVVGDRTVSYAQLDRAADRLAWTLRGHGVTGDDPVAVLLPRGEPLIRALLGVLKAGGAYLPVDPASPPARIAGILAASGARLLLTNPAIAADLPDLGPVRMLDVDAPAGPGGGTAAPTPAGPPPRIHPLQLACVLHTSGSSGAPKRVGITHRGVVRLVTGPDFATLGPGERLLQFAPTAFDASTWEIWGALLTGATAVVAPPDPVDLTRLTTLIRTGGVTVAFLTAGLFRQLAEADATALAGVRQLLTGGDVADPGTVRAVLAARGGLPLVNAYGPTENTTLTSCHLMAGDGPVGDRVPIGRPVPQTTVHVLDADGRPVPVGVAGELCTGGDGLARGYLGDPAATARSFVPDPQVPGERLYRTGDVVRWRADGVLEFLGRRDDQVKIRGFRVEPGEVEAVLRAHPQVAAAAVGVRGDGAQRHLVGYVTPAGAAAPTPAGLRDHVAARLPAHLVPAAFVVLDRLPLTAHGKVDRAALPAPDFAQEDPEVAGPASPTEHRLAGLWSRLLPGGRPAASIGRDSSFFALGGNSLTVTRLMFRIREAFGVELGVGPFYRAPTLAATAASIDAATRPELGGQGQAGPMLRRRDRVPHRSGRDRPDHLARLTDGWALWRTVCLRGAGLPVDLLAPLGDTELAAAADRVVAAQAGGDPADVARAEAAYAAVYPDAVSRLTVALHAVAAHPRFREAVAWQNPHALRTGVDALLRRGPGNPTRNTKHRQHEALVTSYLQRYCAKNDTIGFFGPVGWARIEPGAGVRVDATEPPALLAERTVYLEGWAVAAVLAPYAVRLRPWLVPRLMPFLDLAGTTLRVPLAAPVRLRDAEAAVLRACDGVRDANGVAETVLADPGSGLRSTQEVYQVLEALATAHRIAWQPEVAPHDTRPERTMRDQLSRVTDEAVRAPALAALDELCAARDALAATAGDPDGLTTAMAGLEATFTRLAGVPATRRAGTMYAGRTPVYEECLRAGTVGVGEASLDGIRDALGLVLAGARWFTAAGATLYQRLCAEIYQRRAAELGTDVVPLADFWLLAGEALFHPPQRLTALLTTALHRRWADVLTLPAGRRRVRLTAAELAPAVAAAFPPGRPGWPTARQHSPDLMRAGDEWVLGELHPGVNTLRYATWVAYHPDADALRAAQTRDVGAGAVYPAETGQEGGVPTRQSNALTGPDDIRLVFAHDSFGHDPRRSLRVGECDLVGTAGGLRVRSRDGRIDVDLMHVLGDVVGAGLSQLFRVLPPAAHQPRVTIDSLVVSRESWTFTAADLAFAETRDEALRFRQVRAWAGGHGLPRHVFLRCAGERKPVHADLTSLASVDLVARSVRRARRHGGDGATVGVVEMLPAPDQLWLTGPDGRYTAELRVVAVDGTVR
ncbi:amino acid adenylation domain-containing protein [Micromonospora nigra]|uniref:Amino acid adenylation domain-containing protein n=1 Tax=Micromonospora nigra TaxID=145857 RepID=A0A1C6RBG0_9ACTN|nr:non-ribosomal peptide synthetase [Micromonospora nigra]SCL14465.1 amino acid adenylation domain-containing protein [Micromonospora nigra]